MEQTKTTFIVHGMSCAACEAKVRKALSALDGVGDVSVNVQTGRVVVSHAPAATAPELANVATSLGYQVEESGPSSITPWAFPSRPASSIRSRANWSARSLPRSSWQ